MSSILMRLIVTCLVILSIVYGIFQIKFQQNNQFNHFSPNWHQPVLIGNKSFSFYFIRPGTIALIHVNAGMLSMAYNLLCSLRRLNAQLLINKIIFWAVDVEAIEHLQSYREKNNLSFGIYHPHTRYQFSKHQNLASDGYYQMMRDRPSVFLQLLRDFHLSFIFMDADIVFTADPLSDLFLNEDRGQSEDLIETKSLITTEIFHISVLTLLNHYNKRELISLFTLQILMFTAFQRYVEIQFLTFRSGEISGKKWSSPSVVIRYHFLNNDAKPNYEP